MFRFIGYILLILLSFQFQIGASQHFKPIYSGNPFNPMNILVTGIISIDNQKLEEGDEIGVFDGSLCVGAIVYKGEEILGISASMADPMVKEKNGFKFGNPISFKIWKRKNDFEYVKINARFNAFFDTVYYPLGTAIVELNATTSEQRPKIFPNQSFSVEENSLPNTVIGQLKVDFPQGRLKFELLKNDQDIPFSIDSLGSISLKNPVLLEYNKEKSYSLGILVYCDKITGLIDSSEFTINVLRIPPSIINVKNDTAVVGSTYKHIIRVSNGTSKYLSVISSNLPSWLSIRLENKVIVFEGIPTTHDIGTSEVSFLLSDKTSIIQKDFLIETIKQSEKPSISLYNNPTNGPFKIILSKFEEDADIEILIKNMSGAIVYKNIVKSTGNPFSFDIDLSGNVKDLYFVEARCKNFLISKKLILQ